MSSREKSSSSGAVWLVKRSWNGSGDELACRDGMAEAARTVGFALMSSGIAVEESCRESLSDFGRLSNGGGVQPEDL